MEEHQKCVGGNGKILTYISKYFKYPKDLGSLVYVSQLKEAFPENKHLINWLKEAGEKVDFQGLPSRICWLGLGTAESYVQYRRRGNLGLLSPWRRCWYRLFPARGAGYSGRWNGTGGPMPPPGTLQ